MAMKYFVFEKDDAIVMLAEPEEDGIKYLMLEEVRAGGKFWGKIPYDELKKFSNGGAVDIDPDTFALTAAPLIDD